MSRSTTYHLTSCEDTGRDVLVPVYHSARSMEIGTPKLLPSRSLSEQGE